MAPAMTSKKLTIDELEEKSGVSARTIRYYIQMGLLPPPVGPRRDARYDKRHTDGLAEIRRRQRDGALLEEIKASTSLALAARPQATVSPIAPEIVRLAPKPGVEVLLSDEALARAARFTRPDLEKRLAAALDKLGI